MSAKLPLEPGKYYHVYNHAIGNEQLFRTAADYYNFSIKYKTYISPIAVTIAFCLMPNHFHFCIKINDFNNLSSLPNKYQNNKDINTGINRCFSHFFNSYAQSYNQKFDRMGGLFISNFKRKILLSDDDLRRCICYIHNNPLEANFRNKLEDWAFSSYLSVISQTNASNIAISMEENMRVFDSVENFVFVHKNPSRV